MMRKLAAVKGREISAPAHPVDPCCKYNGSVTKNRDKRQSRSKGQKLTKELGSRQSAHNTSQPGKP